MIPVSMLPIRWRRELPHAGVFPALAYAPSGELIVVGTGTRAHGHSTGSLVVFDAHTGALLREIKDRCQINSLVFSPKGRLLATAESREDGAGELPTNQVRILDVDTLAERCRYRADQPGVCRGLFFTGDGACVVGQFDSFSASTIQVFDAADGGQRWRRQVPGGMSRITVAADASVTAVGCTHGVVVIDVLTGDERLYWPASQAVWSVTYSPDGHRIVAGCEDGTLHVFDADTGTDVWSATLIAKQESCVVSVAVSRDGRWVAGGGVVVLADPQPNSGILSVFDIATGARRFPPVTLRSYAPLAYSPTLGHIIVNAAWDTASRPGAPGGMCVIDARSGAEMGATTEGTSVFDIAPDGTRIVAAGDGFVQLYDLRAV